MGFFNVGRAANTAGDPLEQERINAAERFYRRAKANSGRVQGVKISHYRRRSIISFSKVESGFIEPQPQSPRWILLPWGERFGFPRLPGNQRNRTLETKGRVFRQGEIIYYSPNKDTKIYPIYKFEQQPQNRPRIDLTRLTRQAEKDFPIRIEAAYENWLQTKFREQRRRANGRDI